MWGEPEPVAITKVWLRASGAASPSLLEASIVTKAKDVKRTSAVEEMVRGGGGAMVAPCDKQRDWAGGTVACPLCS